MQNFLLLDDATKGVVVRVDGGKPFRVLCADHVYPFWRMFAVEIQRAKDPLGMLTSFTLVTLMALSVDSGKPMP